MFDISTTFFVCSIWYGTRCGRPMRCCFGCCCLLLLILSAIFAFIYTDREFKIECRTRLGRTPVAGVLVMYSTGIDHLVNINIIYI